MKKKKKLKDFTEEELDEICDKHTLCNNCPLLTNDGHCYDLDKDLWGDVEIEYDRE